jgi:hypothetical protein
MIQLDRQIRDLATTRIDPASFFTSRGSASTFAAMVNVAAGALSSTILNALIPGSNSTNTALGIIERAVEREVEAQVANARIQGVAVNAQGQLINMLRARTQDAFALQSAMRSVLLGQAEAQLRALGLRAQADQTRATALDTAAALRVRRLESLLEALMRQQEALMRRRGGGGGRRRQATSVEGIFPEAPEAASYAEQQDIDWNRQRRGDTQFGGAMVVTNPADLPNFLRLGTEARSRLLLGNVPAAQTGRAAIDEMRELVSFGEMTPERRARLAILGDNIMTTFVNQRDNSMVSESEAARYGDLLPAPGEASSRAVAAFRAWVTGESTEQAESNLIAPFEAAVDVMERTVDQRFRVFGGRYHRFADADEEGAADIPTLRVEERRMGGEEE